MKITAYSAVMLDNNWNQYFENGTCRLTCILWLSRYTLSHAGKDSGFEHRNLVSPHRAHLKYNVACQFCDNITVTWKELFLF